MTVLKPTNKAVQSVGWPQPAMKLGNNAAHPGPLQPGGFHACTTRLRDPKPAGFWFVSLRSLQSSCQRCRLRMVRELGLDAPVRRGHVIAVSMGPCGFSRSTLSIWGLCLSGTRAFSRSVDLPEWLRDVPVENLTSLPVLREPGLLRTPSDAVELMVPVQVVVSETSI